MVERLMRARWLARSVRLWLTVACATCFAAGAQPLLDPTRPAILPAAAPSTGSPAPEGERAWVLQSVRLGPGRAQAAVISGQLVQVGERLGDARLLRVTERHAVLEGPQGQGQTTLWLITEVEKQEGSPAPAAARERAAARGPKPALPTPPAPLTAPSRIAEVTP